MGGIERDRERNEERRADDNSRLTTHIAYSLDYCTYQHIASVLLVQKIHQAQQITRTTV